MPSIVIKESDNWTEVEIDGKTVLTGQFIPLSLLVAEINAIAGLEIECQYGTFNEVTGEFESDV